MKNKKSTKKAERESAAQYKRIMIIDRELASGNHPSNKDLQKLTQDCKGGSSRPTIFRDMKVLKEEFNAPIIYNRKLGGYEYSDKTFRIPALLTTENQIQASRIIKNLIDVVKGTPLYDDAKSVFETLSTVAPVTNSNGKVLKETLLDDDESQRIIFLQPPVSTFSTDVWNKIKTAISKNQMIAFFYKGTYDNAKERHRTVQPLQLIYDEGNWNLWGYDYYDKTKKLFFLSSIKNIEVKKETFTLPEDYDFRTSTPGAFGCYAEKDSESYKIKLTGFISRTAITRVWGKNQNIKNNKDGSIILTFESNQYYPILRWVMSWGADAIPLAPKIFVKDWKNRVQETARVSKLKK